MTTDTFITYYTRNMKTEQSTYMDVTGTAGSDEATIFVSVHYTLHILMPGKTRHDAPR